MSILTEIFVARPEDALEFDRLARVGVVPEARFKRIRFGGLINLQFEILWAILEKCEWDPNVHKMEMVLLDDNGEVWLFKFPDKFLDSLIELKSDEKQDVLSAWAAAEEMNADPSDVEPVLEGLITLALAAKGKGENLYLWGSL